MNGIILPDVGVS